MSNSKLQVTLLADEWKSSKGGLSTINRELAIHLAKHPNVSVTLLVPKCTEDDKIAGGNCNVRIVKAQERPGFDDPVDWLSFPPNDLSIDIIIGHGVKLGKHAQIIRESHQCKWVQVVHTAPEQLSMLKTYSDCDNAISKGNRKQWNEFRLCKIADLVVAVGPRLQEFYSRYLRRFKKDVFNLTPGIFSKFSSSELSIPVEGEMFNILLFGRGDSEDFVLKGFDIAAKAVAQLNDTSYQLVFVGAPSGNEKEVAEKLLEGGLRRKQLIVKEFLEDWEDLATELSAADLAIIPSRSEGFGLTALEALSVGLPFLVTQTSGFGKALQDALPQSTPWVIDSEESDKWTEAIKSVRKKGRKAAVAECQTLRESYGKKYIWESQCNALVEKMISLVSEAFIVYRPDEQSSKTYPEVKNTQLKDESELSSSARSPLPKHQRLTEQRLEEKNGGRREGFTAHDFETTNGRKSSYFISQKTTPEKNLSSGLERPKASGSKMESSVTAAPLQSLNEAIMASIVHRPEEQSSKTHPEVKNKQLKNESRLSSSTRSPLTEDQRLTEQRLEDISGGRREGFTARDFETTSGRKSSCFSSQGTPPEENLSSGLERPKASGSKMESSVTAAPSQSLSEAFTVYRPDEQSSKTHPEVKNAQLKDELDLSSSARISLPGDQRLTEQRLEEKVGRKREGFTAHDFETTSRRRSSYFRSQETTPEKNISSGFERPKASGSKMESSVTAAPSQSLSEAFTGYRPDDQSSKTHPKVKNARLKNELDLSSSARSSLPGDQRLTEQRLEEKVGRKREGFTAHDFETTSRRRSSYFRSQETTPEKNISPGFERPKGISGNDGTETEEFPALSFEEQLKDLTSLISFFEECSMQTCEFIDDMEEKFSDSLKIDLMTDKERECLKSYASKKSTLLVVGPTNSGKSSFVNELLGGSFMPTSEVPCTSRIVRLKYSEKNYIQVLDKSKPSEGKKIFFDKELPKETIELDDSQRGDQSWVNAIVEVGLNNSLLQNGHLEVINAPGMRENEALDKIVEECLHGILQVIIYVIDGNSSLRLQERTFLLNLKEKVGNLPIFFLCNMVDKNWTALEFDKDSNLEEDVDKDPRNEEEKELLAYRALSQCYMVPGDIKPTQCPFFHGLSIKEVRNARLKKHSNQYTKQFDDLKLKLLRFVAAGMTSHLRSAVELLCQIQKRVFGFFLNCDFNQDTIHAQDEFFNKLELKERDHVVKMRGYVQENLYKLSKLVEDGVKYNRAKILTDAAQMQFDSIKIGDVVRRNEVVEQCRRQIKDLVFFKVTNYSLIRIQRTISVITNDLHKSLESLLCEVGKKDDHLATLVRKQLQYSFLQHFQTRDVCPHFDYALMKSGVRLMDNAKKAVIDVWSAIRGRRTYLDEEWNRGIAENLLNNIDCDAIARRICDRMLEDLENGHQLFQFNLAYMKQFCRAALELSDVQKKLAAEQSPYFSRLMSEASALFQTLAFDVPLRAVVGAQIGREGNRGKVFEDKTDKERVVKQLTVTVHPSEMRDEHLLGITRTLGRIQDDISTILRPISLRLDRSNRVSVLFPRMATDLFERLQSDPILLPQGLRITQQIADAVENCWDRRIYHVDLRITNILLDFYGNAKLNVSKPRDDTIPYPDNQAPFHVPTQNPFASASDPDSLNTLQDHCIYSLAVLLLLFVGEKYCRPPYAQTVKVDEVYTAVARGEDCAYVSGMNDPGGRSSGERQKAREIVLSIFDFRQKHNEHLLLKMDFFKSKVTEVVSSHLTTKGRP